MKSKFLQDRGKVSKTEPSAPHSPLYVPDPTSAGKRVSGGKKGKFSSLWAALTSSGFSKGEQGVFGLAWRLPFTNSALTPGYVCSKYARQ